MDLPIKIDRAKDPSHGDYASNLALVLAKPCKQAPRQLAELLLKAMPAHPEIKHVDNAGLGLLIFTCSKQRILESFHRFWNWF